MRFFSGFPSLFRCVGCDAREAENAFLRSELVAIRQESDRVQKETQESLVKMAKDCNDRVMSRSYTEYAVGQSSQSPPMPPIGRSDEEEWLIEQRKQKQVEREVQETLVER